eukprot:9481096-Lingulodinium_polyedra.AAC.1
MDESGWADLVMRVAFGIAFRRGSSCLWHFASLPGKWAQLTSSSPEVVADALQMTKAYWEVWQAAVQRPEAEIKAICHRSFMQWVVVQETCKALAEEDFEGVPGQ